MQGFLIAMWIITIGVSLFGSIGLLKKTDLI